MSRDGSVSTFAADLERGSAAEREHVASLLVAGDTNEYTARFIRFWQMKLRGQSAGTVADKMDYPDNQ